MEFIVILRPGTTYAELLVYMASRGYWPEPEEEGAGDAVVNVVLWRRYVNETHAVSYEDGRACHTKSRGPIIAFSADAQEAIHHVMELGDVPHEISLRNPDFAGVLVR